MKILPYIIGLILLANVFACQRETTYPLAMQQAESLMNTRPDSTLYLLQGMADNVSTLPEEAQMYYHLLTIQAKDKQYITHTSDSLINSIVSFYENYDDNDRLMMAYFYQGSTYRDMNNAPRALKAFHQAIDAGKETDNLTLLGQTYGQMGTLFTYQKLYDEALGAKQKALQLYTQQKDSTRFPYLNRDIARIYSAKHKNDSALYYYQKANSLASQLGFRKHEILISSELGCFLYEINQPQKAKEYLLGIKTHSSQTSNALLYLGHIYKDEDKLDSARIYWLEVLKYGNIQKQRSAYLYLSQIENIQNNKKQSEIYKRCYQQIMDSIHNITQTDTIIKHHLTYKYEKAEKKNQQLQKEKKFYKNGLYFLISTLLISLFCYGFIMFSKMRTHKTPEILESNFLQSNIYQHFRAISRKEKKANEEDWILLQKELDKTYNEFTQRISYLYPSISQQELKICCLIKLKMSNREIANTLYATDSAISMARKRLYKKMVGAEGSGEQLNSFIIDF